MVIADVNADKALAVKANRHLDKVLAKSETPKVKKSKPAKAPVTVLTAKSEKSYLRAMLNSPDPVEREAARKELGYA